MSLTLNTAEADILHFAEYGMNIDRYKIIIDTQSLLKVLEWQILYFFAMH